MNNSIDNTIRVKTSNNKSGRSVSGKFVPSHRKSLSLGANVVLPIRGGGASAVEHNHQNSASSSFKKPEIINYENHYLIDDALLEENSDITSLYKEELKFNKVPSVSSLNSQQQSNDRTDNSCEQQQQTSISINQSITSTNNTTVTTNSESNHPSTQFDNSGDTDRTDIELDNESDSNSLLHKNMLNIKYQGYIRRKTVLKEGKKPKLATWVRYWVILNSTSLIFYSSKSLRGCSRSHFKSSPTKCISLRSSLINVKLDEEACTMDTFILTDDNDKTIYKFKTNTQLEAITWCREISQILCSPLFKF